MNKILVRAAASKMVWAAATLLLLYTLGGFLLAPYLLERHLPRYVEDHLGQPASVGDIRINPYLFILEMSDFKLEGAGDNALLKFERLYLDFELWSSIFQGAWTFADIKTKGFDLRVEIDREGHINIIDLVKRLQDPEKPDQPPPSLIFEHVVVSDSSVSFSDFSGAIPASTTFAPINLELTGFRTFPDDRKGSYTLAVSLPAGASLAWKGDVTLLPLASSGEFSIKGMKLATLWEFLRDELRMAKPRGELALSGRYGFSYEQGNASLSLTGIQAEVSDLLIALPARSTPLLSLRSIRISDARFALEDRELIVPRLSLSDGKVSASRAADGTLDWQRLVAATGAAPKSDDGAGAGADIAAPAADVADVADVADNKGDPASRAKQPWHVRVENAGIENVALAYMDHALSPPLVFGAGGVDSQFKLDVIAGTGPAQVVAEGLRLTVDNTIVAPIAADADAADGEATVVEPAGAVANAAAAGADSAAVGANPAAAVADTRPTPAVATARGEPLATLDSFRLTEGRFDTRARTALVESVAMSNGGVTIARGPDGPVGLLQLALPANLKSEKDLPPTGAVSAVPVNTPWKVEVGSAKLEQFDVRLADRGFTPPIAYDIKVVSAVLENIDSGSESPIVLAIELHVGKQGIVNAGGTVRQDFGQALVKLDATAVPLEPLRPLVARHAALDLKSGRVAVSAELNYRSANPPMMTAQGDASIHEFRLDEAGTEERFISWKTLSARKFALSLDPNRLAIKEVRLIEPGMKLVIAEDNSVNLKKVLKGNASGEAVANQPSQAKEPAKEPKKGRDNAPFPIQIGQVRVVNGTLEFADLSLVLPFSTRVHSLGGAIAGISTASRSRAEVELAGQVGDYGEASATGALVPKDPAKFLDILASFDNIEMPPLSPYMATFAGRKIASGKLWLTLHYKIADGNLLGENEIVLADFKLGERVEAPDALDLPLSLAIELLKGPDDRIKLAVPVRGDVHKPSFDYGTALRAALANVISRIVSSPFRLLAGFLGVQDAEKLRKVEFEPGSDNIAPTQREQLDKLAQALKERPQVGLVVRGPYDAERDGKQLRSEHVHRDLAIATGAASESGKPGEDLGLIAYGDADIQKALEKLLAELPGAKPIAEFVKEYAERTGRQPERVNTLLGFFGVGSEDRAFYEALFERLVELRPLPDNALQSLAASRAQAIIDVLLKAGIDSKRLTSGTVEPVTGKPGAPVAAELSLEVAPGEP